jgi:UDP-2-acetamido-2,6-beta-L-arabino-hexul-4-ose reductase
MKVLVTGADGFIGKNLIVRLLEIGIEVISHTRNTKLDEIFSKSVDIVFVFHLAGVNRPKESSEFVRGNYDSTLELCSLMQARNCKAPVLFTSSTQVSHDNDYGRSKILAEEALLRFSEKNASTVYIYRLPNVFGKWSRPNYNSVVATFCYNVINDIPLQINNSLSIVELAYIDDVVDEFLILLKKKPVDTKRISLKKHYKLSVGDLADLLRSFKSLKITNNMNPVGSGLIRALYATYLSFYRPDQFSYSLNAHVDSRGKFVEVLKTNDFGQFSFFTLNPGMTRGGHYHHTKNEKFLVLQGSAKFGFRNVITNQSFELNVSCDNPLVVETIPGWAHNIKNVGLSIMVVMLWANENFDKSNPDTIPYEV